MIMLAKEVYFVFPQNLKSNLPQGDMLACLAPIDQLLLSPMGN